MITVKLYGLMRVESGIKSLELEADTQKSLYKQLQNAGLDRQDLKGCCLLVNGVPAARNTKFKHGDVVQLLPPVAGG